jgi:hypothetical protein
MTNMKNTTARATDVVAETAARLGVDVESHTSYAITPDFVWYEADILKRDMAAWQSRFTRLVEVVEQQRKSSDRTLQQVLDENAALRKQLKQLKEGN